MIPGSRGSSVYSRTTLQSRSNINKIASRVYPAEHNSGDISGIGYTVVPDAEVSNYDAALWYEGLYRRTNLSPRLNNIVKYIR